MVKKLKWTNVILYAALTIFSLPILTQAFAYPWSEETYKQLIHISGEAAARILIVTLLISPVRLLFPKNRFWKFLQKNKRTLGVASFIYLMVHLGIYIIFNFDLATIFADLNKITYIFGWISFLLLIPVAIMSNNASVKNAGFDTWKKIQRLTYPAAIFAALHWALKTDGGIGPALVHFTPLVLLEIYRIYRHYNPEVKFIIPNAINTKMSMSNK
ncbi:MAG: iron reductase [Calditrichaeota bacterium]|nr:MAG: iron reductase [Calditrichota bacterium]MBL1204110.1 iron reductase [Calditrichota bacterium]NOG43941.1 iron reductase [Calditrichota bacterium]